MNLTILTDEHLHQQAVQAIWTAAVGESRGGDDATYSTVTEYLAESNRRLVAAGHKEYCQSGIYSAAYEQATAEHAYRTPQTLSCTCGAAA